jgi:class 3 adenylate cyclase/ATP/maltotriose-dependent transcriptional regulator MalT
MITCSNCGEENPPKFRLCGFCGTPLQAAAPAQEVRKLVSILFCDLKGSTNLGEALDPESLREVMNRYFEVMSAAITRHGGTIEKYIGDAVMAVFGLPKVHEDDALRAVRAAHAMQDGLRELNVELQRSYGVTLANRIGVNSGGVVAGDATTNQRLVTGDPVNVAARLEQAAGDTETLIGQLTYRLVAGSVVVEEVEPLTLKGKSQPVPAYRLIDVKAPNGNGAVAHRALLGRHVELQILVDLLAESGTRPTPRTMLVIGEAGVGKTRLVDELAGVAAHRALVLRGRCLSYGEGITFWPIVEALRNAASIADEDDAATALTKLREFIGDVDAEIVDRVASTLGLGTTTYPVPEIFFGFRRLLEWLARERPVVLVIEDLHWAEPTLHDLLDSLATAGTAAGALIVATARTEVLEKRPQLAGVPSLTLDRLGVEETAAMIEELLGGPLDKPGLQRIVEASSGNPLFAQQLISMLRDEGELVPEGDGWQLSALPEGWLPPTIHALLSSRIDRLEPASRSVLDPAAVIGHIFPLPAVVDMVEQLTMPDVSAQADELTRTQFLTSAPDRDEDFRAFHHVFIRDSVYESLLKRQRATMHERFVKWADSVNGDRALEYEEILGYHLEQAHNFLSELAPADEHVRELGADAGRRLASAGRRAFVRGDMPAAANLLGRALAVLAPDAPERFARAPELGEALVALGDFERAAGVLEQAEIDAQGLGEPDLAGGARLVHHLLRLHAGPGDDWSDEARALGAEVVESAGIRGDAATVARAYRLLALVAANACRYGDAADAFGNAVSFAREAGDIRQERRAAAAYAMMSANGPTTVEEALARCETVKERVVGDGQSEAQLLCVVARLEAMRGNFEVSRELCAQARQGFEELGLPMDAAGMVLESSRVEMLAGDPVAAERELRRGFDALQAVGERFVLSTLSGLLGHALWAQGRLSDAEDMAALAQELSEPDDIDAQVIWRCLEAKLLASAGEGSEAETLVQSAIDLLESTDAFALHIGAYTDLGEVLQLIGRPGADAAFARARALAEAKGSTAHLASILDVVARPAGS